MVSPKRRVGRTTLRTPRLTTFFMSPRQPRPEQAPRRRRRRTGTTRAAGGVGRRCAGDASDVLRVEPPRVARQSSLVREAGAYVRADDDSGNHSSLERRP